MNRPDSVILGRLRAASSNPIVVVTAGAME